MTNCGGVNPEGVASTAQETEVIAESAGASEAQRPSDYTLKWWRKGMLVIAIGGLHEFDPIPEAFPQRQPIMDCALP